MWIVVSVGFLVLYLGVGGWAVYRVHRMLPARLIGSRTKIGDISLRVFLLITVFLVATTPVYLLGFLFGAVL